MLVINYNGNKPTTDYYKFSVQGNNKADVIRFLVQLNQSGLSFDENYHFYAKVQCVDDDFYDKVELDDFEFSYSENLLKANFKLESKHTSHKQIEVSLSCEDLRRSKQIVWQTQIVKVAISNGVNADEEIANLYPTILEQLQEQIDELKEGGGGGSGYKTIFLELLPSIVSGDNEESFRGFLRLNLINFNSTDVGSYIYLYNKSLGNKRKRIAKGFFATRKMTYKHPSNWNSNNTKIAKLGYGFFANKPMKFNSRWYEWQSVPSFMIHNGYVQTEYEITEQHINQGYMDIDVGREFLQLLAPDLTDDNSFDGDKIVFSNKIATFGQTQFIAFYQIKDGVIKTYPKNSIMVFANKRLDINEIVGDDDDGEKRLKQQFTIKILPY